MSESCDARPKSTQEVFESRMAEAAAAAAKLHDYEWWKTASEYSNGDRYVTITLGGTQHRFDESEVSYPNVHVVLQRDDASVFQLNFGNVDGYYEASRGNRGVRRQFVPLGTGYYEFLGMQSSILVQAYPERRP